MQNIYFISQIWIALCILSLLLIILRPDGSIIIKNFTTWFQLNKYNLAVWLIFQLIILSLPISIPWSFVKIIKNLWK